MKRESIVWLGLAMALILVTVGSLAASCGATPAPAPTATTAKVVAPPKAQPTPTPIPPTPTPAGPALAKDQTVRIADWEWAHLDPGIGGGRGLEPILNLFEGLVGVDFETNELIPLEAESWDISDDGLVYTFHLRKGMKWSDSTPLTAHDYEYAWKRVLNPASGSRYPSTLYPIKGARAYNKGETTDPETVGVKALDDITLEVTLERVTPYFLSILTYQPAYPVPKSAIEKYGDKWTNSEESIVTNGPFMMQKWEHDVQMVAVRNPNYWGPKPTLEKIIWVIYEDPNAQSLAAYENDELDQAYVPETELERLGKDPVLSKELQRFPRSGAWFLLFDTAREPMSDVRVRQALSLAIDRDKLSNAVLKGAFAPAYTVAPSDIPGHNPDAALKGGAAEAKKLLAEAGFPDGQGFPELTLTYESRGTLKLMVEAIQGMWKQSLGINVKLEPLERNAYMAWRSARANEPYDVYLSSWLSDYPDSANWFNTLWDSSNDFFHTRWQNDEFDKLARQGLEELDPGKRAKLYRDAEVILVREAAVVPLTGMDQHFVIKPYVKDVVHFVILGRTILQHVEILEH